MRRAQRRNRSCASMSRSSSRRSCSPSSSARSLYRATTFLPSRWRARFSRGIFSSRTSFIFGAKVPFVDWRMPKIRDPKPDDIVIFKFPGDRKTDYIKRCIAVEGQTVELKGNASVRRRGREARALREVRKGTGSAAISALTVPPGHILVYSGTTGTTATIRATGGLSTRSSSGARRCFSTSRSITRSIGSVSRESAISFASVNPKGADESRQEREEEIEAARVRRGRRHGARARPRRSRPHNTELPHSLGIDDEYASQGRLSLREQVSLRGEGAVRGLRACRRSAIRSPATS